MTAGGRAAAVDAEIRALYAAAPEEFVTRRNALSKALREAGERDAAARVKALQKPTVPAWVLNQLSHRHPELVARLLDAADRVRATQRRALGVGGHAADLREAMASHRQALDDAARAAGAILTEAAGNPAAHIAEVTASLQAAGVDDEARSQLREGTVARPFPAPGLGALTPGLFALVDAEPSPGSEESTQAPSSREMPDARQALEATLERARWDQREAEQRLDRLRQRADVLERRAADGREHAERLAAEAVRAGEEAQRAGQEAAAVAAEVRQAASDLEAAQRSVQHAQQRLAATGR